MNENGGNDMLDADGAADENGFEVAVIGMAGRFPGAANVNQFWKNLCNGVESISTFTDDEVLASGMDPNLLRHPDFVPAFGLLEGTEMFDAAFFRYSPREAKTMAPQHRVMLECAYEALQHAGYDAQRYDGAIGVFAGESANSYTRPRQFENSSNKGLFYSAHASMGNDQDFLSTTVSYKLDLRGPSLTIQTACSTSLVTVHMAYQSLLSGECDIALAGGIALRMPPKLGYIYQKEGILSPDGHCRAFDASAQGTVGGEGVGMVTLKRLEDALADGDCIHAVIKGSALNNDGSLKVGFTAPSIDGQADVIARAQAMGEIEPETIAYIETHGTGTLLGDPIEMAALTRAFRARGADKDQYCAIGSVKTNIGHLDTAAGIAGLIKTVLVLKHRQIPASLHFKEANPQIDFEHSPFFVNQALTDCLPGKNPFRAAVSSFGIGGSNVHMVLEEPPRYRSSDKDLRPAKLLLLSARTDTALDKSCENLVTHLQAHPDLALADVAFTLQAGRQQFQQRRMLVCDDVNDALTALGERDPKRVFNGVGAEQTRPVVFMFPGQGSQYVDMGRELYAVETGFREHFDECCNLLKPGLGIDLRDLLFPSEQEREQASQWINQTSLTQPALFVLEYSLAQLWMSWGVQPQAMIGHSIGEYVAACLSGVISLADALSLVTARAALMQSMAAGSMTAVSLPANEVEKILGDGISVAAINEPSMCVISGPTESIAALEAELENQGSDCRRLHTSHAFHSEMMNDVIQPFEDLLRGIEINSPKIPYISNLTGTWITTQELKDPAYWSRHLRNTVLFAAGLEVLFDNPARIFVEVGPAQTLSSLVRSNPSRQSGQLVISSIRHPKNQLSDSNVLLNALGRLWLGGVEIDWNGFYRYQSPQRIPLPSYPFERQKHWIEPANDLIANRLSTVRRPLEDWFYIPSWKRSMPLKHVTSDSTVQRCLIFCDTAGVSDALKRWLQSAKFEVNSVRAGTGFRQLENGDFTIEAGNADDYRSLLQCLRQQSMLPQLVIHLWAVSPLADSEAFLDNANDQLVVCYHSLVYLAQALGVIDSTDKIDIKVLSNNVHAVLSGDKLCPEKATLLGPCSVIYQEYPTLSCMNIDLEISSQGFNVDALMAEILNPADSMVVAYRGGQRWIKSYETVMLEAAGPEELPIKAGGVYLISGGLGGVGLALAHFLAREYQARLVLTGRSELPAVECWPELLAKESDSNSSMLDSIKAIQALKECGAEVMVLQADVADRDRMREVLDITRQQLGELDGVIHSAGVPGGKFIQLQSAEVAAAVMAPKVEGTRIIAELCSAMPLDFMVICSSLASITGALGQIDYCSANAFQDAYADYFAASSDIPVIAINWDTWNESGMAVDAMETRGQDKSGLAGIGLNHAEGVEVFKRILARATVPQIAVSTRELLWKVAKPVFARNAEKDAEYQTDPVRAASVAMAGGAGGSNPEAPQLETAQDIEKFLCEMWQELLGVEGVAVDDNFFELGGDSLLALQVTSRLRQSLLADLSVASVLEAPNIAELTRRILEKQQSMSDSDQASEMVQRLKSLSPEEKKSYLAEARKGQSTGK